MPTKKTGFTLEQHDQLGLEIQTIRDRLAVIGKDIANHYRKKDKVEKMAKDISARLEDLRSEMEELMFKEHKEKTDRNLLAVYYRALGDDHIRYPDPIRPYSSK